MAIVFRNKTFTALYYGTEPIELVPVVVDDNQCGVGITFPNSSSITYWGLKTPRNLIASWRATEIIRHLNKIEDDTLVHCYYSGIRDCHKSDFDKYVKPTILKIGEAQYSKIMAMPVPEEIIQAILKNQERSLDRPSLFPITDEVKAGTIQWRQEFEKAGVERPKNVA